MQSAKRLVDAHSPVEETGRAPRKPSICFVVQGRGRPSFENQTVTDYQVLANVDEKTVLAQSAADCFLWLTGDRPLRPQAAEECIWGLECAEWVTWKDTGEAPPPSLRECAGPLGVTRRVLEQEETRRSGAVRRLPWVCRLNQPMLEGAGPGRIGGHKPVAPRRGQATPERTPPSPRRSASGSPPGLVPRLARMYQHLRNAEWLSPAAWLSHPLQVAARMIPLRCKQRANHWLGRPFFDLSFYVKFQENAALVAGKLIKPLEYAPPRKRCRRIGILTPRLDAEEPQEALLELARQLDRTRYEIFVLAAGSNSAALLREWEGSADWTYDVTKLVPAEEKERFLYSLPLNWQFDVLLLRDSIAAYNVLPALKQRLPGMRIIDMLDVVDEDWDLFSTALDVGGHLDKRIVSSEFARQRLCDMAVPEEKIRFIRSGVDLARFNPRRFQPGRLHRHLRLAASRKIVLYAGRLDPDRLPLLLPAVAEELNTLRPEADFHIVVAGDGPERERLHTRINRKGLRRNFSVLGKPGDVAELLADSAVLLIPSESRGIPLILLEALAMEVPVVTCHSNAIEEALPPSCGRLVEAGPYVETRLAEAISELLRHEELRIEMGRAGRALVESDYELDRARNEYKLLINELNEDLVP